MTCKKGPGIEVDIGTATDIPLTENEWRWIKVLRIICEGEVPGPNFPADMSMKDFFGIREEEGQ